MQNREIIEHINALGEFTKDKVPVKLSFAIVKNFNKLQSAYTDCNIARKLLLEKYAERGEDGEIILIDGREQIAAEHFKQWNEEVAELLAIDVEVNVYTIDLSVIENLELGVSDMAAIEFMIRE